MTKKALKKGNTIHRLKIIEGHLKKITQMVEENKYCIDIIQQTTAVRSALKKVEDLILDKHLHSCVIRSIKKNEGDKVIQEVLEIYKKSNK